MMGGELLLLDNPKIEPETFFLGVSGWSISLGRMKSWKHVLKTSAGPEGVRRRVARLRAFGFPVPLRVPDRPTTLMSTGLAS